MPELTADERFQIVSETIRERCTTKTLASPDEVSLLDPAALRVFEQQLQDALATAGWAPFHFDRQRDGIPEPWRVHFFRQSICQQIADHFGTWFQDVKPGNKLPGLLRGCGAMLLVNWLPQGADEISDDGKREEVNLEHHAASAAFTQNLLVLLTARGFNNYWASGGQLRTEAFFQRFDIPPQERVLAAVFVEHPATHDQPRERIAGNLRTKRSDSTRWVSVADEPRPL